MKYIEELSQSEAAGIKKTIQDLFRQTCILQVKCDPVTLVQRDNPRYRICANHREFIADYLSVLDCDWCMTHRNISSALREKVCQLTG